MARVQASFGGWMGVLPSVGCEPGFSGHVGSYAQPRYLGYVDLHLGGGDGAPDHVVAVRQTIPDCKEDCGKLTNNTGMHTNAFKCHQLQACGVGRIAPTNSSLTGSCCDLVQKEHIVPSCLDINNLASLTSLHRHCKRHSDIVWRWGAGPTCGWPRQPHANPLANMWMRVVVRGRTKVLGLDAWHRVLLTLHLGIAGPYGGQRARDGIPCAGHAAEC